MNFIVVPFIAHITHDGSSKEVAQQLQRLINEYASQGWEYLRLESVETAIAADAGCFGLGAKPGYTTVYRMAVFKQIN